MPRAAQDHDRVLCALPAHADVRWLSMGQIYQPQFGMGNQLRALEAGLAVARVLKRILVVPDYISDNGEGGVLAHICVVSCATYTVPVSVRVTVQVQGSSGARLPIFALEDTC